MYYIQIFPSYILLVMEMIAFQVDVVELYHCTKVNESQEPLKKTLTLYKVCKTFFGRSTSRPIARLEFLLCEVVCRKAELFETI